jgi:hypothetical protein
LADIISSDSAFSLSECDLLKLLVDMMIPSAGDFPSASEPSIFAATIAKLAAHEVVVQQGLATFMQLADDQYQQSPETLSTLELDSLIEPLRAQALAFVQSLQTQVVTSYYQNNVVLQALGIPAGPPYPGGYDVTETDWSLLDPVRARKPFYRTP